MDAMQVVGVIEARLRPVAGFLQLSPSDIGAVVKEFRQMRLDIDNLQTRLGRLEGESDGEG